MPVPEKQLKQLKVDLENHAKELKELESSGDKGQHVRARIKLHKTVLKLGHDSKILKTLDELHDQPSLTTELAKDPAAFIQARGIELPTDDAKVVVLGQAPQTMTVGIHFNIQDSDFRVEWNREAGFRISQLQQGLATWPSLDLPSMRVLNRPKRDKVL